MHMRIHPNDTNDPRRITLHFSGVQHLEFSQTSAETGIDRLSIEAVRDRGWNGIMYEVHDPGQQVLAFYCASFEVAVA